MRGVSLVKILIIFFEVTSAVPQCDMTTATELDEGNMGQTSDFQWLGILQVFLNEDDDVQVAISGIVLIKADRALACADDVVRIPKRIFQHDTRAMFFPDGDVAVNYSLVSYVTHPEYQTETFNSIAIILLNIDDDSSLVPICFPFISYDTSYLYLTGFTDENEILEKMIHRIKYTDRSECEEFYEKEGLIVENRQPISYLCGKGHNSRERCVWDNGMALVSNSSGWFTLIGFSIHGPGCAAPARFISILHYSAWIRVVTRDNDDEEDDFDFMSPDFRRSGGFNAEYIPIHRTFTAFRENGTNRADTEQLEETDGATEARRNLPKHGIIKYHYVKWPFIVERMDHYDVMPSAGDKDVIWIMPFNNTFERNTDACASSTKKIMYSEDFSLTTRPATYGTVYYKLALLDLTLLHCTCVTLEVKCTNRTEAYLEFKEASPAGPVYTPDDALQFSLINQRVTTEKVTVKTTKKSKKGTKGLTEKTIKYGKVTENQNPNLKPKFIEFFNPVVKNQNSYDLTIKFSFKKKASLKFTMWSSGGEPQKLRVSKKKIKFPRKKMNYWGSFRRVDKNVKADPLVVDREVVLETASEARRSDVTPGLLIIGYLLISACSTRILFI